MKIALLSFEYPPDTGFGGIGTYTWYQARALARLGHDVHVLAGATGATRIRSSEHDGVTVHRYRANGMVMRMMSPLAAKRLWWTKNRLENAWSMHLGLRKLRRQHRFDVIEMPECGGEGMLVNRFSQERTVVRFHSPAQLIMPFYDVESADIRWCSRAEQFAINGAASLTSCSTFLADEVGRELGERRPITVIPNGIDLALFDAADHIDFRRTHSIPTDRPLIFFAGRMERRKGSHLLLDMMIPILERHEVAFAVAGHDQVNHVADVLQPALAARRLRGSFHYLGRLEQAAVRSGVCQSDIFLLPSLWESCPYSCLEAMAAGRAIVASDQGGIPELIHDGENGLLAECGNASAFSANIERLLDDGALRNRLGQAARDTVIRRFSDHDVAERSVAVYASELGRDCGQQR